MKETYYNKGEVAKCRQKNVKKQNVDIFLFDILLDTLLPH